MQLPIAVVDASASRGDTDVVCSCVCLQKDKRNTRPPTGQLYAPPVQHVVAALLPPPPKPRGPLELFGFCYAHLPGDLPTGWCRGSRTILAWGKFTKAQVHPQAFFHQALLHRQRCSSLGSAAVALYVRKTMGWKHVVIMLCMFRPRATTMGKPQPSPGLGSLYRQRRCQPLIQGDRRRGRPTPPLWLGEIIAQYHADAILAGQSSLSQWMLAAALLVQATATIELSDEHRQWAVRAAAVTLRANERNRPQNGGVALAGWQVPQHYAPTPQVLQTPQVFDGTVTMQLIHHQQVGLPIMNPSMKLRPKTHPPQRYEMEQQRQQQYSPASSSRSVSSSTEVAYELERQRQHDVDRRRQERQRQEFLESNRLREQRQMERRQRIQAGEHAMHNARTQQQPAQENGRNRTEAGAEQQRLGDLLQQRRW